MPLDNINLSHLWQLLTRLGEFQMLLPTMALVLIPLARQPSGRSQASCWLLALAGAAMLTLASKLAFLGWGMGSSSFNFTGVSGHAMFAAAIYPLAFGILASQRAPLTQGLAVGAGCCLALVVGLSRVVVGVHSGSEVVLGLFLGGAVSVWVIVKSGLPRAVLGTAVPILVLAWFLVSPVHTPQLPTHSWVTRLSLVLSGQHAPYTRTDLLRGTPPSP